MAVIGNLVHELTTGTGTGNLDLTNVSGKQSFNTAFGNGATTNVFFYFISHRTAAEYEWGTGHMSDSDTLVRDTVVGGSNGTSAVNFSAGTKDVTNDLPAENQSALAQRVNVLCPHEGLIVKYISATTVDIDADGVTLFHANGQTRRYASLNETLDITASGANGLDTGAEGSSRWYHIWAIGKYDGTLDGLLSESSTAPTLPSGYVFNGYLGAIRNDGSSNFVSIIQRGNNVFQTQQRALNAGAATTFTTVDLSAFVPPTATSVPFRANLSTASGTNYVTLNLAPAGSGTTPTYGVFSLQIPVGSPTAAYQLPTGSIPMSTNQQVAYFIDDANARAELWVEGWMY